MRGSYGAASGNNAASRAWFLACNETYPRALAVARLSLARWKLRITAFLTEECFKFHAMQAQQ